MELVWFAAGIFLALLFISACLCLLIGMVWVDQRGRSELCSCDLHQLSSIPPPDSD